MKSPPLDKEDDCSKVFSQFKDSQKCQEVIKCFTKICKGLQIEQPSKYNTLNHLNFYDEMKKKSKGKCWQLESVFKVLDQKFSAKEAYLTRKKKKKCCETMKVLVIGGGPVGMRAAIEMAILGAKVVVVEMRTEFTRNNVLHLWPFLIEDIRDLAGKKFFGKFCSGDLDHVGIKQLQLMLLKTLLIFGIEYHTGVKYNGLIPPEFADEGWKAKIEPSSSPVSQFTFDVIIGADARKNTFEGFPKKMQGGNLALGITCNFENLSKQEDTETNEISVSKQYMQDKFVSLEKIYGISLENCVYYRGETHYFVMTAKKQNLLQLGVLKENFSNAYDLLHPNNIHLENMKKFARSVAKWATDGLMPERKFADNGKGCDDIAIFDFTKMTKRVNSSRFEERNGKKLLIGLVGDALVEPFWPLGTGASRGFLGALDLSWMAKHWWSGYPHLQSPSESNEIKVELDALAIRETTYHLLYNCMCQDIFDNTGKKNKVTINPETRYKEKKPLKSPAQVANLYTSDRTIKKLEDLKNQETTKPGNKEGTMTKLKLIKWCSSSIFSFKDFACVLDMSTCWHDGLAYCALIQAYRPHLIDVAKLNPLEVCKNNQLAFDTAQQHLKIASFTTGRDVAAKLPNQVDELQVMTYILQFYNKFKNETPTPYERNSDVTMQPIDGNEDHPQREHPTAAVTKKNKSLINRIFSSKKRPQQTNGESESGQQKKPKPSLNIFRKNKKYEVSNPAYNEKGEPANLNKFTLLPSNGEKIQKDNSLRRNQSMRNMANGGFMTSQKNGVKRSGSCRVRLNQQEEGGSVQERRQRLMNNFMKNAPEEVQRKQKVEEKREENNGTSEQPDSSNYCYFCNQKIYLSQQQECENHFFHRKCFVCKHCQQPLNSFNHYYHKPTGEFFCQMHKSIPTSKTAEKRPEVPEVAAQETPETTETKKSKFSLNPFTWFSKKADYVVNIVEKTPETENKSNTLISRIKRLLWSFAPKCTLLEFIIDWLLLMVVGTCIMVAHHYITVDMIQHPDH